MTAALPPTDVTAALRRGVVIPAHPLALTDRRELDERRQRALTRYYLDAGAGGLAIGVHTTQFAIREAGLYGPVLRLGIETARAWTARPVAMIAGVAGRTDQALAEAETARGLGYDAALLALGALKGANEDDLIRHCRTIAEAIPVFGFYLQPSVGGIALGRSFWRRLAAIENVVAIKIAPFNRYHSLDVIHGVVEARAEERIALYTGNDDHILLDLLCPVTVMRAGEPVRLRVVGGLLGQWSVWTRTAVEILERAHAAAAAGRVDCDLLALDSMITDANAAIFDIANDFHGAIAGCHEVLRRQGLLDGIWCLDPDESLGPGQRDEISRVLRAYPHLSDDAFVAVNRDRWLDGGPALA